MICTRTFQEHVLDGSMDFYFFFPIGTAISPFSSCGVCRGVLRKALSCTSSHVVLCEPSGRRTGSMLSES